MTSILDLTKKRDAHVDQRLHNDYVIWLNSVRPDNRPHSVVVWFVWDGETVLIFSKPQNQKIRNLRQNPNVVLSFDNSDGGNDPITIEGTAQLLEENTASLKAASYVQKYAEGMKGLGATVEEFAAIYSQPIRITPTRVM